MVWRLTGVCRGLLEACTLTLAFASSPQTLKTLRQVEAINFGDCLVRSKGAVAIAEAVRGGLPKLKVPAPARVFLVGLGFPHTRGCCCGGRGGVVSKARWALVHGLVLPHLPSDVVQFLSPV